MISASHYHNIYLILVSILSFIELNHYHSRQGNAFVTRNSTTYVSRLLLCLFVVLFVGLRPVDEAFGDTIMYNRTFELCKGQTFIFDSQQEDILFNNLLAYIASLGKDVKLFFLIVAAFYFGLMSVACRRLFPRDHYAAFLVFLAAFSTFSYGTNGIRAGMAASLFMLAISYRENLKLCIPLVVLTFFIHHSMSVVIASFLISIIIRQYKWYIFIWIFALACSITHTTIFQVLFANIADESGAEYLLATFNNEGYLTGFRPDFIVYSVIPIFMGWRYLKQNTEISKTYSTLLNIYTLSNAIWLLCMYASYSNRIAYLSWFIYPILLIYPYLNEEYHGKRYILFAKVATLHLLFTLFMQYVYYPIVR